MIPRPLKLIPFLLWIMHFPSRMYNVMHYTRGGQHVDRDRPVDRRVLVGRSRLIWIDLTTTRYLKRTFLNQYFRMRIKMKNVAFYDIPYLCGFVTDRSIARYQEIFWSILVKDKLATPGIHYLTLDNVCYTRFMMRRMTQLLRANRVVEKHRFYTCNLTPEALSYKAHLL